MSSSGSRDDQLRSTAASDVTSKEGEVTAAGRSPNEEQLPSRDRGKKDDRAGAER